AVNGDKTSPDASASGTGPAHADNRIIIDAAGLWGDFGSIFETFDGGLRAVDRGDLSILFGNGGEPSDADGIGDSGRRRRRNVSSAGRGNGVARGGERQAWQASGDGDVGLFFGGNGRVRAGTLA